MKKEDFLSTYWQYYLHLEQDFLETARYVTLEEGNANTYSLEYIKLYMAICSEIDVFLKFLTNKDQIHGYVEYICSNPKYHEMLNEKVIVLSSRWKLFPFSFIDLQTKSIKEDEQSWWKKYNCVKHARIDSYKEANLKNTITALAALYALEEYFFQINYFPDSSEESVPLPKSKLFSCENLKDNYSEGGFIEIGTVDIE